MTPYTTYDILIFETSVFFIENLAKGSSFLREARMALIRLCLKLLYKGTFFFVDSFYVFKNFIAILLSNNKL